MKTLEEKEVEKQKDEEKAEVKRRKRANADANPDPITGEPGSHPVGVAGGGVAGGAAGAAIGGALGGPIGGVVGAAIGAVAGGLAGKGVAEVVDPTVEDAYWRDNYKARPYYKEGTKYESYAPAYRYGWEKATHPAYRGRKFDEVEPELEREWPSYQTTGTAWRDTRDATKDAFDRVSARTGEAGRYTSQKAGSVWDRVDGNWKQFKGHIKEKWNQLTNDDVEAMEGKREKIIGKIQERYGAAKWTEADIERELDKAQF